MKNRFNLLILLLFAGALASCVQMEDLNVNAVNKVQMQGVSLSGGTLEVELEVENASRTTLKIKSLEVEVQDTGSGKRLCTFDLPEAVTFRPGINRVVASIRMQPEGGMFGLLSLVGRIEKKSDTLAANVRIKIRNGWVTSTKRLEGVSLKGLLEQIGVGVGLTDKI